MVLLTRGHLPKALDRLKAPKMNDQRKKLLKAVQELLADDESATYRFYQRLVVRLENFPKPICFGPSSGAQPVNDAFHGVTDSEGKAISLDELVEAIRQRDQAIRSLKVMFRGLRDREAERLATRHLDILPLLVAVCRVRGDVDAHGFLQEVDEAATVAKEV